MNSSLKPYGVVGLSTELKNAEDGKPGRTRQPSGGVICWVCRRWRYEPQIAQKIPTKIPTKMTKFFAILLKLLVEVFPLKTV